MNLERLDKKQRMWLFIGIAIPLIVALGIAIFLRISWSYTSDVTGERFAPVENEPLFVGLIIFIVGYLFFVGMIFSENILNHFYKRRGLRRR